jgi:hypothetical protein
MLRLLLPGGPGKFAEVPLSLRVGYSLRSALLRVHQFPGNLYAAVVATTFLAVTVYYPFISFVELRFLDGTVV